MAQKTPIEWADKSWNPIRGCSRVSEGCSNCYAERVAARFSKPGQPYEGLAEFRTHTNAIMHVWKEPHWTGKVKLVEKDLDAPLRWRPGHARTWSTVFRSQQNMRIFVNSMSDLFHKEVPDEWIDRIFAVMALTPEHRYLILTKRPERMMKYINMRKKGFVITRKEWDSFLRIRKPKDSAVKDWTFICPLPQVWLGVSVEDQETADQRIPFLMNTPAAVRFVSYEPALGPIGLPAIFGGFHKMMDKYPLAPESFKCAIDWVICGGESGPNARPMHPCWAEFMRDQCIYARVPFFFKQWGEWEPVTPLYHGRDDSAENGRGELEMVNTDGYIYTERDGQPGDPQTWLMEKVGKKAAGRLLDGREWNEFPKTVVPA